MSIEILEQRVTPRRPNDSGEDRIFVGSNYLAVVDGATDKSRSRNRAGATEPGAAAADGVMRALEALDPHLDARAAMAELSRGAVEGTQHVPGQSASAVVYSRHRHEVWIVGSGSVRFGNLLHQVRPAHEEAAAAYRAALWATWLSENPDFGTHSGDDPGREAILPLLRREKYLRNVDRPGSLFFGSLDGDPVPPRHISVLTPPDVATITLASDGYPEVPASLDDAESELSRLLEIDPLCIAQNRQTKGWAEGTSSFDDRAWLKFHVTR